MAPFHPFCKHLLLPGRCPMKAVKSRHSDMKTAPNITCPNMSSLGQAQRLRYNSQKLLGQFLQIFPMLPYTLSGCPACSDVQGWQPLAKVQQPITSPTLLSPAWPCPHCCCSRNPVDTAYLPRRLRALIALILLESAARLAAAYLIFKKGWSSGKLTLAVTNCARLTKPCVLT